METVVELVGMKFYAYHGVFSQETKVGNEYLVDVLYSMPLQTVFYSDSVEDTINYAHVYALVKQEMAVASKLLETVSARIMRRLKGCFPELSYVKVKLTKLNPPLEGEVYGVSVIVEERWSF